MIAEPLCTASTPLPASCHDDLKSTQSWSQSCCKSLLRRCGFRISAAIDEIWSECPANCIPGQGRGDRPRRKLPCQHICTSPAVSAHRNICASAGSLALFAKLSLGPTQSTMFPQLAGISRIPVRFWYGLRSSVITKRQQTAAIDGRIF